MDLNQMKQHNSLSKLWPNQMDLLTVIARQYIVFAVVGIAINSLWFFWDPFWPTFSQNVALSLAALLGWLCLSLARRGHFYPAVRLLVGASFGVALLIILTVGEYFIANGTFLLATFLLIGIFTLPPREFRFWLMGAVATEWLGVTLRYSIPLSGDQIGLSNLTGLYLFSGLALVILGFLGRTIIRRLNEVLVDRRAVQEQLQANLVSEQTSEDRYRTIFSISPDLIYLTDLQGKLLDANPALLTYVGLSLADIKKLTVIDFFAGQDPNSMLEAMAGIQHGQPIYGFQVQAQVFSHEVRDFEINAMPVYEAGEITAILSMARDITERKQNQVALQKRLKYKKLLVQLSAVAVQTENFDHLQQQCVTLMVDALDVSRIYIFEYDPVADTMNNTVEWVAPDIAPQKENLQGLPAAAFSRWMEILRKNQVFKYEDIEDIPDEAEKELLRAQQVKSILVVPLLTATGLYGFIGLDVCNNQREWLDDDVQLLLASAGIISAAIERKRAIIKLRLSEKNYRLLSEMTSDIILLHNIEGRICYVNKAGSDFLGFDPAEILGKPLGDFVPPELMAIVSKRGEERVAGDSGVNHYELEFMNQDGERIPFDINSTPIVTNGRLGQILIVARNITERKQAEKNLKQSEKNYRELFNNATDAIYIQDKDGYFLDVNQGALQMYGYPKAFFIGKTPEVLSAPGKNDLVQLGEYIKKAFAGEPQQFEFWGLRSNGEIFPKIVRFQKGEYFGQEAMIVFAIDISSHKNMEAQLVRQERLAAVGQLSAGIAHDFNNILTSILGFAELLQISPETPDEMHSSLQYIIKSGQRAANLVRQILDFSGKTIRHPQPLDLSVFLAENFTFLRTILPENIQVKTRFEEGNFTIAADSTQLQQLVTNLAINARDAMPNGGILTIRLAQVAYLKPRHCSICSEAITGKWVTLEVTDTGTGIQEELLSRIFEPFFTTKEVGKGSGLGLSQVAGIAKQHGGHISLISKVGQGTTFTIYLPATTSDCVPPKTQPLPMVSTKKETILLVEDEPTVLEATTAMLQQLGYQTLAAPNGQQAITIFETHKQKIVLVISDMVMPDMDGEALFHHLKAHTPQLKMVMMSGYPLGKKGAALLEQGVVDWFQKPISFKKLSQVVSQALSGKTGRWG